MAKAWADGFLGESLEGGLDSHGEWAWAQGASEAPRAMRDYWAAQLDGQWCILGPQVTRFPEEGEEVTDDILDTDGRLTEMRILPGVYESKMEAMDAAMRLPWAMEIGFAKVWDRHIIISSGFPS